MSANVEVFPNPKEGVLLDLMGRSSTLPTATLREQQMDPRAQKELLKLVQKLFLAGPQARRVVVFASVEPGSGSSFICTQAAKILARQLQEPVCLVDANFRSPGLKKHFDVEGETAASHDEDWTFMTVASNSTKANTSNLWLVSYRPAPDCPRLASHERFRVLIEDLRKDFTYVVIDAPALNEYADTTLFARPADGIVMVLEANTTRRDTAQKAKELLEVGGIPVVGAILNNRTYPIPESVYRRL